MSRDVRYGILHDATDEAALYELMWRSTSHIGRRTIEHHPERTVDEVRPVLVELLKQGFVEMYEISDEQTLDVATALSVVADEASWVPAGESAHAIGLTKSGDEELRREAARRRVSA